jgi:hypothetical protein
VFHKACGIKIRGESTPALLHHGYTTITIGYHAMKYLLQDIRANALSPHPPRSTRHAIPATSLAIISGKKHEKTGKLFFNNENWFTFAERVTKNTGNKSQS